MRIILIFILVFVLAGCSLSEKLGQLDKKVGELLDGLSRDSKEKTDSSEDSRSVAGLDNKDKKKIDQWLEKNNLNRYGDPKDTYYIGGTPLFSEATGERIDRYDYIFDKIPDILDKIK